MPKIGGLLSSPNHMEFGELGELGGADLFGWASAVEHNELALLDLSVPVRWRERLA